MKSAMATINDEKRLAIAPMIRLPMLALFSSVSSTACSISALGVPVSGARGGSVTGVVACAGPSAP